MVYLLWLTDGLNFLMASILYLAIENNLKGMLGVPNPFKVSRGTSLKVSVGGSMRRPAAGAALS